MTGFLSAVLYRLYILLHAFVLKTPVHACLHETMKKCLLYLNYYKMFYMAYTILIIWRHQFYVCR